MDNVRTWGSGYVSVSWLEYLLLFHETNRGLQQLGPRLICEAA